MAQQVIFLGTNPNDGTGESLFAGGGKINNNFTEIYALQSQTINAGAVDYNFTGATFEQRIQLAIVDAGLRGFDRVYVPAFMLPYNAALVTFNTAVRMVREGGNASVYDVLAYGAADDGVTTSTRSFIAALAGAATQLGTVGVPDAAVGYLWTEIVTMPINVGMVGQSKHGTRIIHGYNGPMMQLALGDRLENLWLDGNGASFSGSGIDIYAGHGKQTVRSCKIVDFATYCIDFKSEDAGSQSYWEDLLTHQLVGLSPGEEAIIIRGTATALANVRTFVGMQTEGLRSFNTGKANNLLIFGSRIGDVLWDDDTVGVAMTGGRWAGSDVAVTVKGSSHTITGMHIKPQVTVGTGVTSTAIKGNSYDNPPIIDLALSASNDLENLKDIAPFPFVQFASLDATPDVSQGKFFQCNNAGSTTITYFDGGIDGQRITVRLDLNTSITHNNSFIRLAGSASIGIGTQVPNNLITFIRFSSIWFEETRSNNLIDAARDIDTTLFIAGGFRQTPDGWNQDNVAASQTNVELVRADGRWRAARAGSVTGVIVTATEARTVGTLTVTVFKNTGLAGAAGSTIGLTAVLDGTNTSRKASLQTKDTDTFAAGDEIYAVVTTDAGWLPVTSDIRVAIEVET